MTPTPSPTEPAARGPWARLWAAHFHDYSPAALRMWLAIVCAGVLALGAAMAPWFGATPPPALHWLGGLLMVAAAAWFPIEIPRSKYSVGVADAFIFAMMAVLGPAAAVLAAGLEGAIGAARSTRRWTSRISTPSAAMAAMWAGGWLFERGWQAIAAHGLDPALARLVVLPLVAVVPISLASLSLISTVTLKRGEWPRLGEWFAGSAWMVALAMGSALLAGLVQLSLAGRGPLGMGVVGAATLIVVLLLGRSTARIEAAHQRQEDRLQQARREAELSNERFAAAFASAAVGMAIVAPDGAITRANEALCRLLQRAEAELVGLPFSALVHGEDRPGFLRQLGAQADHDAAAVPVELRCPTPERTLWVEVHRAPLPGAADEAEQAGWIVHVVDFSSRRLAEQRLHYDAYHDSLTGLANRAGFNERVAAAVEASRIDPEAQFAVVFFDLDRFKVINDSLGHQAGNELLRAIAGALAHTLGGRGLAARLGGDEFAVLLPQVQDKALALQQAEALLVALSQPVAIRGHEIVPQASAGITFSDLGYRTVDELLRDADLAMYEAKAAGRARLAVYDRSMHERMVEKMALEADLRRAIGDGELSLVFQPLYRLADQQLLGFEALARWAHPRRGPVSPAVFVALAEEAGHIEALTRWALDAALSQLAQWHAAQSDSPVGVSVNVSGHDLARPGFVAEVLAALHRHRVAPALLTLELTETVLMTHVGQAADVLQRLRAAGVGLAVDDFGTGYSSLAYLSRLPIDSLKIDRSFVSAMDSERGIEIVRAVTHMGLALGKQVVAEGIEDEMQLATLRHLGVTLGQGYLLSRPLEATAAGVLLSRTVPSHQLRPSALSGAATARLPGASPSTAGGVAVSGAHAAPASAERPVG